jgi:nucleoside-diphosphate-sugar epimerase
MRLLVAGITGQLGAGIVESCDHELVELVPLARPLATRSASARLRAAFPGLAAEAVQGDVTQEHWGLDAATIRRLAVEVDGVLNVAGATNWAGDKRALHAVNATGALRGYQLAHALGEASGTRKLYCYASSIHAAGGAQGSLPELPFGRDEHRTAYELSKWLGETSLLEKARREDGPALCIARIGGLVGNSQTGATSRRNSLYMLADRLEDLPLGLLPISRGGRVDMLHRDVAAGLLLDALRALHERPNDEPEILHVCAGESAPTTEAVFGALDSADHAHRRRRPRTLRLPLGALLAGSEQLRRYHDVPRKWENLLIGLRYLSLDRIFERGRLASLLGRALPSVSIEALVRSAFELPERPPAPVGGDASLARFAG